MKKILTAATALIALSVHARAQMVVIDPASILKEADVVMHTAQTVNAVAHGNMYGLASVVPGLGSGIAANPLGSAASTATSLMSGSGGGGILSGLFNQFSGQTLMYRPTGTDTNGQLMVERAQAAAGQMTVAQQYMNGSSSRLSMLPQLSGAVNDTPDIKASMDANTRVATETMNQGAQQGQLMALQMYQQAEEKRERSRVEQAYRKGADCLVSDAKTAANTAAAGQVTLVSGGTGCSSTDGTTTQTPGS